MSKAAKRLGRGLESLISNLRTEVPDSAEPVTKPPGRPGNAPALAIEPPGASRTITPEPPSCSATGPPGGPDARRIPIDSIIPNPFQPRKNLDDADIDVLAGSIAHHGILQPLTVRRAGDRFQLIAGERRWRAAKKAGLTEVPAIVRVANDQQMLELALVENLQRKDLNPIDRAKAYRQFCREFGLSSDEVAERVGDDRTTVTNYIRLLDLEPEIQALVSSGELGAGHARSLLAISDSAKRREMATLAVNRQLSVRAVEELSRVQKAGSSSKPTGRSAHLKDLESRFEQSVKTKVMISEGRKKGSGRIMIEYYTLDDFDRIAGMLGVKIE